VTNAFVSESVQGVSKRNALWLFIKINPLAATLPYPGTSVYEIWIYAFPETFISSRSFEILSDSYAF
jgi:hypothetical protein